MANESVKGVCVREKKERERKEEEERLTSHFRLADKRPCHWYETDERKGQTGGVCGKE